MKTLNLQIGVFQKEKESIAITIKDRYGKSLDITSVNNHEGSKREHQNLHKKLKALLVEAGYWEEEIGAVEKVQKVLDEMKSAITERVGFEIEPLGVIVPTCTNNAIVTIEIGEGENIFQILNKLESGEYGDLSEFNFDAYSSSTIVVFEN